MHILILSGNTEDHTENKEIKMRLAQKANKMNEGTNQMVQIGSK